MSSEIAERNRATMARFYGLFSTDAFRNKDFVELDQILSPAFTDHNLIPGQGPGVEGLKGSFAGFYDAFPDFGIELDDIVASDDGKVAVRMTISGTHTGDYMGIPGSGRSFRVQGMNLIHLDAEGHPTDRWGNADWQSMAAQIGLTT